MKNATEAFDSKTVCACFNCGGYCDCPDLLGMNVTPLPRVTLSP